MHLRRLAGVGASQHGDSVRCSISVVCSDWEPRYPSGVKPPQRLYLSGAAGELLGPCARPLKWTRSVFNRARLAYWG